MASSFPERVARKLDTLWSISLAHAALHLYSAALPLVYAPSLAEFQVSYTALGALLAMSGAVGGVTQFASGHLPTSLSSRTVLAAGLAVVAVASAVGGLAASFTVFATARVAAQVGQSPQHVLGSALIAQLYAPQRRGRAFAVHFTAGNVGGLVGSLAAVAILSGAGWRFVLFLFAFPIGLIAAILLGSSLGRSDVHEPRRSIGENNRSGLARAWRSSLTPIRDRDTAWIIASGALAAGGRGTGVLMVFVPLLLADHFRLPLSQVGALYLVLTGGSIVGPLALGAASGRYGKRKVLLTSYSLASAVTIALVSFTPTTLTLVVSVALMGLTAFGNGSLLQALIADHGGTDESRRAAFGTYFLFVRFAGGAWPLLLAAVIEVAGFNAAFWLIALSYILAAAALMTVHATERR